MSVVDNINAIQAAASLEDVKALLTSDNLDRLQHLEQLGESTDHIKAELTNHIKYNQIKDIGFELNGKSFSRVNINQYFLDKATFYNELQALNLTIDQRFIALESRIDGIENSVVDQVEAYIASLDSSEVQQIALFRTDSEANLGTTTKYSYSGLFELYQDDFNVVDSIDENGTIFLKEGEYELDLLGNLTATEISKNVCIELSVYKVIGDVDMLLCNNHDNNLILGESNHKSSRLKISNQKLSVREGEGIRIDAKRVSGTKGQVSFFSSNNFIHFKQI